MSLLWANLVLLLLALQPAVAFAAIGDGTQQHKRQSLYQNVFFSELPRMKGRPSTSFVMVRFHQNYIKISIKSENGPLYHLQLQFTFPQNISASFLLHNLYLKN